MRFEVIHQPPGHDTPTSTVTDAAGVDTLLAQAATTGSHLHIRPHTPAPDPGGAATQGDPQA